MMRRALPLMVGVAGSMLAWTVLAQNAPAPAVATNTPATPAVQTAPAAPPPVTNTPAVPVPAAPTPVISAPAPADAPSSAPAVPTAPVETAPGAPVAAPSAPVASPAPAPDAPAAVQPSPNPGEPAAPAQAPMPSADANTAASNAPANPMVTLPGKPIDPAAAAVPTAPATGPEGKVLFNDMADNWQISVMFPPTEARKFERFMAAKKRRATMGVPGGQQGTAPDGSPIDLDAAPPPPPAPTEAPAFYLSTIIYKGENKWAVWLRGYKFTPENLEDGTVTLINVTKQRATFEWIAEGLDVISPNWEEKVKDTKQVKVKDDKKTVVFSLFPNQSFVSRVMKVIEGKAESTPLGDGKDQKTADGAAPADAGATPGDGRFDTQAPPTTPAAPEAANPPQAPQAPDSVNAANAKAEKLKQAEKAIKGLLDPMKPSNHPGVDALENKPPAEATGPARDAASAFKDRVNNGIVNPDSLPAPAPVAPAAVPEQPATTTTPPATVTP